MYDHSGNLTRVFKANVCPCLARVSGLVHAVTVTGCNPPNWRFTGSDIDNVLVGFGDRNGTDCPHAKIPIRHVIPRCTRVVGFPDTAARGAHIIGSIITKNPRYRGDTTASPRADFAPLKAVI